MERENMVGMGADEINIEQRLEAFGHDASKQRNHRQRYRYNRLVRHELNKERMKGQLRTMIGEVYMRDHKN